MHACVRARTGMQARFAIPSSRFYVFLLILYEKIIMLHKARYVKKNGVGKGRRCRQEKKKIIITDHPHSLPSTNSQKDIMDAPRSKHGHLIDYVIVRRKDRQNVRVTKTMCGADCWTDHRLVVSKRNLRIQPTNT